MSTGDDMVVGQTNQADSETDLLTNAKFEYGLYVYNSAGGGIIGVGDEEVKHLGPSPGVLGESSHGPGVLGHSEDNAGVHGKSITSVGVSGESTSGAGVAGESQQGHGVSGSTDASSGAAGVFGSCTAKGGIGVFGQASSGTGVNGESTSSYGVYGKSKNLTGVHGQSEKGTAIFGYSKNGEGLHVESSNNVAAVVASIKSTALYAQTAKAGGNAGEFHGNVTIAGNLDVTGVKSAVVPFRDGSHRRVYCQESPEPWFEDFNEAKLIKGRAEVRIDPDFAETANLAKTYHVFVQAHDSKTGALAVVKRLADRFVVEERDGRSSGTFSYRLVARRRDISGRRLERVKVPKPLADSQRGSRPGTRRARA